MFISYRRDDAAPWAGRLHMALEKHFRRDQIFMDVDSIRPGLDFARVLDAEVANCDVMLVVIGRAWVDAADAAGRRRLDDPADFVRLEVESAQRRDIRVVPVLVDGATLPKAEDLPEGMRALVRRQAWPLSHARFGAESEGLIAELARTVAPVGSASAGRGWADGVMRFIIFAMVGVLLVIVAGIADRFSVLGSTFNYPFYGTFVAFVTWLILSIVSFLLFRKLRASDFWALWLTSAIAGAHLSYGVLGRLSLELDLSNLLAGLIGLVAGLYAIASGPAFILWRRRKRIG